MTKKISVLIPSRGRPEEFGSCIENLFDLAEEPDDIEVIARLDKDDNHRRYPEYKNTLKIIGPRYSGYADNHKFIEEAAAVSTGDFIMQYVDTARMLNPFWDQAYLETIGQTKIFVATADQAYIAGRSRSFRGFFMIFVACSAWVRILQLIGVGLHSHKKCTVRFACPQEFFIKKSVILSLKI